jgi:hypothetical protein
VAGAFKLVDPSGSIGALRALGVEVDTTGMRVLAAAELGLGVLALSVSSVVIAVGVCISYAGFAGFVAVALTRDVPIDSCGCLGRLETPPGLRHLGVVGVAFFGAAGQVIDPSGSMLERLTEDGAGGVLFTLGVLMLSGLGVTLFRAGRRPSRVR